ncbi:unnamed protein product [Arabidopsis halleri]
MINGMSKYEEIVAAVVRGFNGKLKFARKKFTLKFDDEEVEESYLRLRERERSHAYMRDCAKAYCSMMNCTDLIPRLSYDILNLLLIVFSLITSSNVLTWNFNLTTGSLNLYKDDAFHSAELLSSQSSTIFYCSISDLDYFKLF